MKRMGLRRDRIRARMPRPGLSLPMVAHNRRHHDGSFLTTEAPDPFGRGGAARTAGVDARHGAALRARDPHRAALPEGMEPALVGLGCFWGAERIFWQAGGVYT